MLVWWVGRGREPWEQGEAGEVNDNERHLHHSPVSSSTEELRKDKRRSDNRGQGRDFSLCFVCGSRPWGAVRFTFVFDYFYY